MENENKENNDGMRLTPFGEYYEVMELEGIGKEYGEKLLAAGIVNTKQLWEANTDKLAEEMNISPLLIKRWQNMAELSCIKDIGPQYSELLERSGVHNIEQLSCFDAQKLLNLVTDKQSSLKINIQGNTPGIDLVSNWIQQASAHKFTKA